MASTTFKYSDSGLKSAWTTANKVYTDMYNNPSKYGYNAYQSDVDSLFDQVMNYGDFSYDMEKDALFQMYKQQYNAKGNTAMKNQMGIAAANSGGYNSSYAQTSAQNTYQSYMDELSEKAADTYENAYNMWNQNYSNLLNRYNTASDMNNAGNTAYWNQLSNAATKATNAYNVYQDDYKNQYTAFSDNRTYQQTQAKNKQDQANWQKEYNLNKKLYSGK